MGDVSDLLSCGFRILAEDLDGTMVGFKQSEDQLEQRCFSASVRPDHCREHAFFDFQVDIMEDFSGIVGEAEVFDVDDWVGAWHLSGTRLFCGESLQGKYDFKIV